MLKIYLIGLYLADETTEHPDHFSAKKNPPLRQVNTLIWIFITKLGAYIEAIMAFERFTRELSIAGCDWIKFFLIHHCVVLFATSTGAKSKGAFVLRGGWGSCEHNSRTLSHKIAEKSLEVISIPTLEPFMVRWEHNRLIHCCFCSCGCGCGRSPAIRSLLEKILKLYFYFCWMHKA